jgi:hypothetical protein
MNYAIIAYVATAIIWIAYFIWLKRRISSAHGD